MVRHDDAWATDREGASRAISAGPVPVGLTLCTERIVRLRIGARTPGPESRHVPPRGVARREVRRGGRPAGPD